MCMFSPFQNVFKREAAVDEATSELGSALEVSEALLVCTIYLKPHHCPYDDGEYNEYDHAGDDGGMARPRKIGDVPRLAHGSVACW